jgi:signal transduction histidine kinase
MPRTEGDRRFIDGISTNTTERRQLAEQREQLLADQQEQVRRLKELDRMKDELVALVSHELRNPLGIIRGYVEMLRAEPDLDPDHRHLVEVIDRNSGHMQRLVDDLLEMARLDAGRLSIDPRTLPLRRLISDSVDAQRPAADAKQLTVSVDMPRHLTTYADPVRLRQVIDNLLSNAIKYTPAGGTVRVTALGRPDTVPVGPTTITVTDSGIGIPAEQYAHLFDRFFRASNAVSEGIKGTGLGLAITKAIVTAHHGTITASPATPAGTTFSITLPGPVTVH